MNSCTDNNYNDVSANPNHIANINPIRYRSYYYDNETGFYYLQSRYYDPYFGRFLNGDVVISGVGGDIMGYNMYAYAFNNPVNNDDNGGDWPKWVKKAAKSIMSNSKKIAKGITKAVKKVDPRKVSKSIVNFTVKAQKAFVSSFEVSVEAGMGLGGSAYVGLGLGIELSFNCSKFISLLGS